MKRKQAIQEFLRTGDHDSIHAAWPGNIVERCCSGDHDLRQALAKEIFRRSKGKSHPSFNDIDYREYTRRRVEPMVRGFFPPTEREIVLSALEKSVVFLTANNIESVILNATYLHTAWTLANLYLESVGADLLGPDAQCVVGLSEETTCYLSTAYFHEKDRFADFLVHEAAHLFHNCRRRTIGLIETEKKPWPLTINFLKREEFAYACEFYSRILALSSGFKERLNLFTEFRTCPSIPDDRVNLPELLAILEEAVKARNGWKRILARCAPDKKRHSRPRLDWKKPA
ncbi:MAG: hypothetical protein O2960_22020 [Verrucomicrobia bacterium]|nr:hypothetical protein [Verrucomicrobiota bacterium]